LSMRQRGPNTGLSKHDYEQRRQHALYADFKQRRLRIYALLGGRCFICEKKKSVYHLHHVEYHPVESAYPRTGKAMWTRWLRLREAEAHPERFRLLCSRCHLLIEHLKRLLELCGLEKFLDAVGLGSLLEGK